jgi:[pyruvate, water dikinase]-phosphate phosphotransferase / [pyruvate, water dikinase] kinase
LSAAQEFIIAIVSDGTGETAATMVRAAVVLYPDKDIKIIRHKNVRTEDQAARIIDECLERKAFLAFTMASRTLASKVREMAAVKGVPSVDLLDQLLNGFDLFFGSAGSNQVGALRVVDELYFKRIEAIEYTVKHDDGKTLSDLNSADIILVGVSRTSKTPLSIFLSHKGWKVANVPLVLGNNPPPELFQADQRRIVALTIDMDSLQRIRKNRLEKFGQDTGGSYASMSHIAQEIEFANQLFKQNKRWPVFNVTERALEETASEIIRVIAARLGLPESVLF